MSFMPLLFVFTQRCRLCRPVLPPQIRHQHDCSLVVEGEKSSDLRKVERFWRCVREGGTVEVSRSRWRSRKREVDGTLHKA